MIETLCNKHTVCKDQKAVLETFLEVDSYVKFEFCLDLIIYALFLPGIICLLKNLNPLVKNLMFLF